MIALIGRFIGWLLRRVRPATLLQFFLLWLTLGWVARGLLTVVQRLPAVMLSLVVILGLLTGWIVGMTRLRGWKAGLTVFAIGFAGLGLTIGRIGGPLLALPGAFLPPAWGSIHCTIWPPLKPLLPCVRPDFSPLFSAWAAVLAGFASLATRTSGWLRGISGGIPVVDPLVTTLVWGLALWATVSWAAWWVRGRDAILVGLVPPLALLAYNVYYTNDKAGLLWLVLAAGGLLLMQSLEEYLKSDRHWAEKRMARVGIEVNLAIWVGLLAIGFSLAGGLLPSISIVKIHNELQDLFNPPPNKNLAESLGLQQTPEIGNRIGTTREGISISASHAIGAGPHLTDAIVMYVSVQGYQPPAPPEVLRVTNAPEPDVRYYWRVQTYDSYNGHVWIDDASQTLPVESNAPFHPNLGKLTSEEREVVQTVERVQPLGGALFAAGKLVSVDQLSQALWRAPDDLIAAQTAAGTYTAVSRIPYVNVGQLRAAGTTFPDAIRNRYLTLPDTVPQRVRDLALDLTANQVTIYDRALAIQTYLRQFPYSLDVPAPPVSREVTDYFLFDLKKGYCDYYATSMVVLARAAGLPARLVTGYTSGNYDYSSRRFVVVDANAHAWVEIYFPNIGWVEFEPTTNMTPIPHPGEPITPVTAAALPTPAKATPPPFTFHWSILRGPLIGLGIVLAGLLLLLVLLPLGNWLLYYRPAALAVTTIYQRLYRLGIGWGIDPRAGRTPDEFAALLSSRLERPTKYRLLRRALAAARTDLAWLTGVYTRLLFSPDSVSKEEHHQAVHAWMRLQWKLLWLQRVKI